LKRERGQLDATLFVTGRDVEREQELALRFEAESAQWRLLGNAEEVGRTRARREILDLLREQTQEEGMRPREIAAALEKNYHTTRALLCKMVESGEVSRVDGRYVALSLNTDYAHQGYGEAHRQPEIAQQGRSRTPRSGVSMPDALTSGSAQTDYGDYDDVDDEATVDGAVDRSPGASSGKQEEQHLLVQRGTFISMERQEEERQRESATGSHRSSHQCHQSNHGNHGNHSHLDETLAATGEETGEDHGGDPSSPSKPTSQNRCPHHPRERLVRFDPLGQAWCDRLDCWDCYRLMSLGEKLGYGSLTDRGGKPLIGEGSEAWSAFVLSQRPFLIMLVTEAAIVQCKAPGLDVPDLSGEVKQLVRIPPLSP